MPEYEVKTQEYDNFIANVFIPKLEEEEKKAIREHIKYALVQFGREKMKGEK